MFTKKHLPLHITLVAVLALAIFALSCSPPATKSITETVAANQTSPGTTTYQTPDLSNFTPSPAIPGITTTSPYITNTLNYLADSDPAKVDNSTLPVTPVNEIHITGAAPQIDIDKYRLVVDGLVDNPLSLTYDAIMQFPTVTEVVLLICPGVFADNAEWTGVPVTTILNQAGVQPKAANITFYAGDGYKVSFSLKEMEKDGVFLAYMVDGQVLPKEHGYPLRLVVKGDYGNTWVKWVEHIEIK